MHRRCGYLRHIPGCCHLSFHLSLHSSNPKRNQFPHGGRKFLITSHIIRSLVDTIIARCVAVCAEDCKGWIRHVNENMRPNAEDWVDFTVPQEVERVVQ